MTPFPKITIQAWTDEGPAYTIHRALAGFRNRKQRRARDGSGGAEELVGDHGAAERVDGDGTFLVFAQGNDEAWAFKRGYVYEVDIEVDWEPATIHVDAREYHAVHEFKGGVRLVKARSLTEDEVAELLDDLEDPNVNDYDEITAPGEKGPEGLEAHYELERAVALDELEREGLTGEGLTEETPTEETLPAATAETLEQPPAPAEAPTPPPAPAPAYVDAQDEALDREGDYEANLGAVLEERAAEPAPEDLSLEDLEALTAPDGSVDTDEDAAGGGGGKPVDADAE